MRKTAVVALLLSVALAAADPADSEVKVTRAYGNALHHGSGTVVASADGTSRILTNHHVCPGMEGRVVVTHKGKEYGATVLAWDAGLDLACLEVKAKLPACEVATEPPKRGSPVYQWGHERASREAVPKEGRAVGINGRRVGGGDVWETTIASVEGDSGCGVFNAAGRLVGVCWGRHTDRPGEVCVALADVRRFLKLEDGKADKPKAKADPKPAAAPPPESDADRLARLRAIPAFSTVARKRAGLSADTTVGGLLDRGINPRGWVGCEGWLTGGDVEFLSRSPRGGNPLVDPYVVHPPARAMPADCPPGQP